VFYGAILHRERVLPVGLSLTLETARIPGSIGDALGTCQVQTPLCYNACGCRWFFPWPGLSGCAINC